MSFVGAGEWVQRLSIDNALSGIRRVSFRDVAPLSMGRYVHLLGLLVRAKVSYTSTLANMPAALPKELVPSVLTDFRLRVGAHEFLRGTVDGADLLHCARQRVERSLYYGADIPAADGAGTATAEVYIPTSRPACGGAKRYDYSIPVRALAECGESEFTFSSATSARGFAGVVFADTATSCEVFGHFAALDHVRETVWHWERFSSDPQKLEISSTGRGGCEALMWRTVSSAGDPDVSNATEVLLTVDGRPIGRAMSGADLKGSVGMIRAAIAPLVYGPPSFDGMDIITHPTDANRTKYPRGRIEVSWATRAVAERFIGMFTGDRSTRSPMAIRSALGAKDAAVVPAAAGKLTRHDATLDGRVYWRGMPGVAASKARDLGLR